MPHRARRLGVELFGSDRLLAEPNERCACVNQCGAPEGEEKAEVVAETHVVCVGEEPEGPHGVSGRCV